MTTTAPDLHVSASRTIAADPDTVWAHLTEVSHFPALSPENVESTWEGDERGVGATFKGRNRISLLSWRTVATVTEWEPGRRFAFVTSAPSRSTWVYDLEPVEGGTLVTESVTKDDPQPLPIRLLQRAFGVRDRAQNLEEGIEHTLGRLDEVLTGVED